MSKQNNQAKQFWEFKNSADNPSEATLYIYGDIVTYDLGWWNWPDDVVPHRFRKELTSLGDVSTIHVRINSNGGSVFGAYGIMNLLKSHKAEIITYNDGIAASAATLVAMAGDKVVSALGSVWMIHLPSASTQGNIKELEKTIDILKTITEGMQDIYHAKTGIDRAELLKMMNEDTWMTATQALEKGFVDEITDTEVEAYLSEDTATAFFNGLNVKLEKVRNKDVLVAILPSHPQNKISETENMKEETLMTLAELQAKHPALYAEAVNVGVTQIQSASMEALTQAKEEGRKEGITAERERIKAIDALALPGMEALTDDAKFNTGITAEAVAMALIKTQKEKGINFLNNAKADAKELDEVTNAGAPQNDDAEETAMLAHLAAVAGK